MPSVNWSNIIMSDKLQFVVVRRQKLRQVKDDKTQAYRTSRRRQLALHQSSRTFRQPVKSDAHAMSRIAVYDIRLHDGLFTTQWKPHHQCRANRNLRLRAHVESTEANVSRAGDAGGLSALEMNINDHSRAIKSPALVLRSVFTLILFNQVDAP